MSGPLEGGLKISLRLEGAAVRQVRIESSRPVQAARLLEGKPPETAVQAVLPALFHVCGRAHLAAAQYAIEGALGAAADDQTVLARRVWVEAENLREHLLRVFMDWPVLMGRSPRPGPLAQVKALTEALAAAAGRDPCRAAVHTRQLIEAVAALRGFVESELLAGGTRAFLGIETAEGLRRWARQAATLPAAFLRWLEGRAPRGAEVLVDPLPELAAVPLRALLDGEDWLPFVARPTWEGRCRETGPLARQVQRPLLRDLLESQGDGTLTARFAARLVELAAALEGLSQPGVQGLARPPVQAGLAAVETSRGRLVHRVLCDDERIRRYRILAPTEWNFHPEGVVSKMLRGIKAQRPEQLRGHAALVIQAVDPCVGYRLELQTSALRETAGHA
ncbi:MAG: nickel-dependent hydrogenase large subunit [Chromatiales bacterium]|nr:nickel-dependent hydrogenase large subunit [Chromatiales bacterium]